MTTQSDRKANFNLSEEVFEGDGEASFIDGNFYHEKDVKEFIQKERILLFEFMNKVLNTNTKSKNFIEIPDFKYHLDHFIGERSKLLGDKLR